MHRSDFYEKHQRLKMLMRRLRISPAWAILVLAVFALMWPAFRAGSIPAFRHDWSWSPTVIQAWQQALQATSYRSDDNFGAYNYYSFDAPYLTIVAALSAIVTPGPAVALYGVAVLLTAAYTMHGLLRRAGIGRTGTVTGCAAYVLAPLVVDQLGAGHLAYLLAYAAFPAALVGADLLAGDHRRGVITLCASAPFLTVQPQFAAFFAIGALVLAVARRSMSIAVAGLIPIALLPLTLAIAFLAHPSDALSVDHVVLHYQAANGVPLSAALFGTGYPAGYDVVPEPLQIMRILGGSVGWLALLLAAWRSEWARCVAFCGLLGVAGISGVHGPLAQLFVWLYLHVPAMALFRENFHFAALVALPIALGLAWLTQRLPIVGAIATLAFTISAVLAHPLTSIPRYNTTEIATISRAIAAAPPGPIFFVPTLQPLTASIGHGSDPDGFPFPHHHVLFEYVPTAPLFSLDSVLRRSPANGISRLRAAGVRYVLLRTGWRSAFIDSLEPRLREVAAPYPFPNEPPASIWKGTRVLAHDGSHWLLDLGPVRPRLHAGDNAPFARIPVTLPPAVDAVTNDPTNAWVDARRWFWLIDGAETTTNLGALTLQPSLPGTLAPDAIVAERHGTWQEAGNGRHFSVPVAYAGRRLAPPDVKPATSGCFVTIGERAFPRTIAHCKTGVLQFDGSPLAGWQLLDRNGRSATPRNDRWAATYAVSTADGPYRMELRHASILRLARALQFGCWLLAGCALALRIVSAIKKASTSPSAMHAANSGREAAKTNR